MSARMDKKWPTSGIMVQLCTPFSIRKAKNPFIMRVSEKLDQNAWDFRNKQSKLRGIFSKITKVPIFGTTKYGPRFYALSFVVRRELATLVKLSLRSNRTRCTRLKTFQNYSNVCFKLSLCSMKSFQISI